MFCNIWCKSCQENKTSWNNTKQYETVSLLSLSIYKCQYVYIYNIYYLQFHKLPLHPAVCLFLFHSNHLQHSQVARERHGSLEASGALAARLVRSAAPVVVSKRIPARHGHSTHFLPHSPENRENFGKNWTISKIAVTLYGRCGVHMYPKNIRPNKTFKPAKNHHQIVQT